jgi:hypothetical protein
MPVDVTRTLQQALSQLQSERDRIDRQIRSIESVLGRGAGRGAAAASGGRRRRRRMSAAARRAVSQRMKAYWASRRAAKQGKGKAKAARAAS